MFKKLKECHDCLGKGEFEGVGMMLKKCQKCKYRIKLSIFFEKTRTWIFSNPFKKNPMSIALSFFILMVLITYIRPYDGSFSVLVASFGSIFIALKYKLDQSNYHRSLFDERYVIFLEIQKIIFSNIETQDWREIKEKFDNIYRKSFFLFSKRTYNFISQCQLQVLNILILKSQDTILTFEEARKFIIYLREGQNLSNNFPELKIDEY